MTSRPKLYLLVMLFAAVIALAGCSREDTNMPPEDAIDYQQVALEFTKLLAARDYATAYTMTSRDYRKRTDPEQLRAAFENIVPTDWGQIGPIEIGHTMTNWPDKQAEDAGWVYVSIGGDVYSEAIIVVVSSESGAAKIREVEFGRP